MDGRGVIVAFARGTSRIAFRLGGTDSTVPGEEQGGLARQSAAEIGPGWIWVDAFDPEIGREEGRRELRDLCG